MSITKGNWRDAWCEENKQLDIECRSRWGISVEVFKTIKALTQSGGVLFIMYLAVEGMIDPELSGLLVTAIITGPDYLIGKYIKGSEREKNEPN